jgi:hypothetical protein
MVTGLAHARERGGGDNDDGEGERTGENYTRRAVAAIVSMSSPIVTMATARMNGR